MCLQLYLRLLGDFCTNYRGTDRDCAGITCKACNFSEVIAQSLQEATYEFLGNISTENRKIAARSSRGLQTMPV